MTTEERYGNDVDAELVLCEPPQSPPGDDNHGSEKSSLFVGSLCEPPQSPPGDDNRTTTRTLPRITVPTVPSVNHRNPRQGMTTTKIETPPAHPAGRWCEPPQSPPGDDHRTTARDPGTAPDAPGAPICALPDFPPSPACGGPPAPPPTLLPGAPVRRSGRRQPALTPPRPPAHRAGAAASTALLITALRRPTPTGADSRRPTPIHADRRRSVAGHRRRCPPARTPQDGARRPRNDGTAPSRWAGSGRP